MEGRWTALSLRVESGTLTAEQIEGHLGEPPARKGNAGDRVSVRSPAAGVHQKAFCVYECPVPDDASLQMHIDWLVNFLSSRQQQLKAMAGDVAIAARVGFSANSGQGGFALLGRDLAVLADFDVDLLIDLHRH